MPSTLQTIMNEVRDFADEEGVELSQKEVKEIANHVIGYMTNYILEYKSGKHDSSDDVSPAFRLFQSMKGQSF